MSEELDNSPWEAESPFFVTTDWHIVKSAGIDNTAAHKALSRLCEIYWYPIYAYVRKKGRSEDDARDITQSFFARLLEKRWLEHFQSDGGKFRSYLLTCVNHYMINEWRKEQTQKRGAGVRPLSMDFDTAEHHYRIEPPDLRTPEKTYERAWACSLLKNCIDAVEKQYRESGRETLFNHLKGWLTSESDDSSLRETAEKLGKNESTVRVDLFRLRQRLGEEIRIEVARTLSDEKNLDEEIRYLIHILGNH